MIAPDLNLETLRERARVLIETTKALVRAALPLVTSGMGESTKSVEYDAANKVQRAMRDVNAAISDLADRQPETSQDADAGLPEAKRPFGAERRETHPSYGCISVTRTSGGAKLFGSDLPYHQHFITLLIQRASGIFRDFDERMTVWPQNDMDGQIVEVVLSAAQFADMITQMNIGFGIPCTLRSVRGRSMPNVPETHTNDVGRVLDDFLAQLKDAPRENHDAFAKFNAFLDTSTIPKKTQEALRKFAHEMHATHGESTEFVLERFTEAKEKVLTNMRTEVDATLTFITHHLGLQQLQAQGLQLGTGAAPTVDTLQAEPSENDR